MGRFDFGGYRATALFVVVVMALSCNGKRAEEREEQEKTQEQVRTALPSDRDISREVKMELQLQAGVNAKEIEVSATDGIVTLTGETDNMLAKDRAANIAGMIKGVRGVVNEISVQSSGLSDAQVKQNVEDILQADPVANGQNIDVKVENGKVTLLGKVETWQEKILAARVAKKAKGVAGLDNQLDLQFSADRTDMEMERAIKRINRWDIQVDDGLLDVDVNDGEAKLSGVVGSVAEKNEAVANAWVKGIKSVDVSDLRVERWARDEDLRRNKYGTEKSDEEVRQAINDVFIYDPRINPFKINVGIDRGEVTLTGVVDNLKAKDAAGMSAHNVVGVYKVNNLLQVERTKTIGDKQLSQDIKHVLSVDPYVERFEVTADVNQGKVNLTGVVDNYFEKYKAYDDVASLQGVAEVDNNILVNNESSPYVYDFDYNYYHLFPKEYSYKPSQPDSTIKKDIRNQIWWSPFVNLNDVEVTVDGGVAKLTGAVDSWMEYNAAEKNAYEGGAVEVDNELKVAI